MKHAKPPAPWTAALIAFGLLVVLGRSAVPQEAEEPPSQEPAAEEPVAEEPVAEEPGDEAPDQEPAAEEPGDEAPDQEPAADEPAEDQVGEIQLDAIIPTGARERGLWRVQALYELHFNLISDEYSANDWLSFYMLKGDLNLTDADQISLRLDLEQRYIADLGENGLWFGDMRLYYSRSFGIPIRDFRIPAKASVYLTAPTSRASRERSYITQPTAALTVAPSWGPLTLVGNGYFRYSFAEYAQSSHRGDPNNMLTTGFWLQLFYTPFDWFAPSVAWQSLWHLSYPTRENDAQPWQRTYYLELALNFSIPMPERSPSLDLSLAYGQGASVLEDGVYRLYFAKRDQSEIYLGLNLAY